jgi:hypothetical protein
MSGTSTGFSLLIVETNGVPVCSANSIAVNVGSIDVSFSGDPIVDWLLKLFRGDIEGAISDAISKALPAVINDFVNKKLNPSLAGVIYDVPLSFPPPYNIRQGIDQKFVPMSCVSLQSTPTSL